MPTYLTAPSCRAVGEGHSFIAGDGVAAGDIESNSIFVCSLEGCTYCGFELACIVGPRASGDGECNTTGVAWCPAVGLLDVQFVE